MAAIKEINERYQPGKLFVSEHRYHIIMIISQLSDTTFWCYKMTDLHLSKDSYITSFCSVGMSFLNTCD